MATTMLESLVASSDISDDPMQSNAKARWMNVLMRQNAALESEVRRLCGELDEATKGVLKRGYLYKHR